MAFIRDSVGTLGRNDRADVVVIVELILTAHENNSFLSPVTLSGLREEFTFYLNANNAVREFIGYASRLNAIFNIAPSITPLHATIFPDDLNYRLLLACVVCGRGRPSLSDYETNPLLNQALQGRISYQTFMSVIARRRCGALSQTGIEARNLLTDARVRAFLDVLAFAEGNTTYSTGFGHTVIEDLSQHPGTARRGSSASGRYQFLTRDWNDAAAALGLFDFTPESQDIAAAHLLRTRPRTNNSILAALQAENFNEAVQRASFVWASLPHVFDRTSDPDANPISYHMFQGKRQPAKSRRDLSRVYQESLARYRR